MQIIEPISPRAEQLISEYDLGRVRAEYKQNLLMPALVLGVLLLVGLLLLISALPIWQTPQTGLVLAVLLSLGGCFSLLGVWSVPMIIVALRKGEQYIYVGDKGFIPARYQVERVMRWEAIQEIRRYVQFSKNKENNTVGITQRYTIIPAEGSKRTFSNNVGLMIEQTATAALLPRMLEDYSSGRTLSFGWLALNSEGIHLQQEPVPAKIPGLRTPQKLQGICAHSGENFASWDKLARCWIDESASTFILSRKSERYHWAILPLSQVPNSALCLAIIEYVLFGDTKQNAQSVERR